jgi:DNA-binding NarL/FixJ family response regulator
MGETDRGTGLSGLRVLLVEDNFLVAAQLRDMLADLGCEVVGPVGSLEEGLRVVEQEHLGGAILDLNIGGGSCEPIAAALRRRHCPFFFVTGYGSPPLQHGALTDVKCVLKPVDAATLRDAIIEEIIGGQPDHGSP